MSRSFNAPRIGAALAAALFLDVVAGASLAVAQPSQTTTTTSPSAVRACRVKEHAGGKTCTANVTEGVCAAIAREASGTYIWTDEDCP